MQQGARKPKRDPELLSGGRHCRDLSDMFEDDPRIQRQLLIQVLEGDGFKQRVIQKLIEELRD